MPQGVHMNTFGRGSNSRFFTSNWLTLLIFSFDFGAARSCACCCWAFSAALLRFTASSMFSASSWLLITSSSSNLLSSVLIFLSSFASGLAAGSEASAILSRSVGMALISGVGEREFDSTSLSSGRFSPLRTFAIWISSGMISTGGSGELDFNVSLCGDWASIGSSVVSCCAAVAWFSSSSSPRKKQNTKKLK